MMFVPKTESKVIIKNGNNWIVPSLVGLGLVIAIGVVIKRKK
jgi:LPXTG-motif cell wall-anchored protein